MTSQPYIHPGHVASLAKILSAQHRVGIINELHKEKHPLTISELSERTGAQVFGISQHISKLLSAEIVEREVKGTYAFISLTSRGKKVAKICQQMSVAN